MDFIKTFYVMFLQKRAGILSLGSSMVYGLTLSMINILIPLYAIQLGFNALQIGILIATPGISQIMLRLFGGVLSDQFGEKRILWIAFSTFFIGGIILSVAATLFLIFIAQLFLGISRSIYWPSSQSYASRINEKYSSIHLGKLTSYVNGGQVFGLFLGGVIATVLGYKISFILCSSLAAVSLLFSIWMPELPRESAQKSFKDILTTIPTVLRVRPFYLAGILSFIAALPLALVNSFYPVYFHEIGYNEAVVGFLNALRPIGAVIIGMFFSIFLSKYNRKLTIIVGVCGIGVLIIATPFIQSLWILSLLMIFIGIISGAAQILNQVIVTEYSNPERRGISLSVSGMFWSLAILIVPIFFGWMVMWFGLMRAFIGIGCMLIVISIFSSVLYDSFITNYKKQDSKANVNG